MTYTESYWEWISKHQGSSYTSCLNEFLTNVRVAYGNNIYSIILFGGLVRDPDPIPGWSDIDLIIIFYDTLKREPDALANIEREAFKKYSIRLDVAQISLLEIEDQALLRSCMNSEIINALSMRDNVSAVLYGSAPRLSIPPDQEKLAALFYLNSTHASYRRYLVETVYRSDFPVESILVLPRAIRWTFSIVRASLRLFDIYTHPYEYSIPHLERLLPGFDISLLFQLLRFRQEYPNISLDRSVFLEIERFLDLYIRNIIPRYYGNG